MTARTKFLVWYSAAWTPLAALYAFMIYQQKPSPQPFAAIEGGVETIGLAALLGLFAWSRIQRLAERPRSVPRWIVSHAVMGVAYTAIWNGFTVFSIWLSAPRAAFEAFVQFGLGWSVVTGLILYGLVAGVAYAAAANARVRRETEAAARADALRTRAELSAIRAQMNPHFLFNTLHSISALVRSEPQAAEDALERLAVVLRRLLDANRVGVDRVTLADEWEIITDQLALEKLRFGERLMVVTNIESEALDCLIPTFTLQPLVENAIRHGVSARTQRCTVTISARVAQDVLTLDVRDDGPGADVRHALSAAGLGVRSIRTRLLARYGDRAGLHLESKPGSGFAATVSMPAEVTSHSGSFATPAFGAAVRV